MPLLTVRRLVSADRSRTRALIRERWGDDVVVVHGEVLRPSDLPGFAGLDWEGLVTYRVRGARCEIVTIDALEAGVGVGTALLAAVVRAARQAGCAVIRVVATNDNLDALAWYERRGFRVVEVRRGEVARSRLLKPSIPKVNDANGLPIEDEVELELRL
jgi:GNAT superfamily N-acetyltransferase